MYIYHGNGYLHIIFGFDVEWVLTFEHSIPNGKKAVFTLAQTIPTTRSVLTQGACPPTANTDRLYRYTVYSISNSGVKTEYMNKYLSQTPYIDPQALSLLQSVKKLPEEAHHVHLTCPNLNSLQVQHLLNHCLMADTEQTINPAFAEQLILFAESHVDDTLRREDNELGLEEDPNAELPFSLPQRGYYTDSLKGIPSGLHDYLEPMISSGECVPMCVSLKKRVHNYGGG